METVTKYVESEAPVAVERENASIPPLDAEG